MKEQTKSTDLVLGIVGSGQMGSGIALAGLISGYNVRVFDENPQAVEHLANRTAAMSANPETDKRGPDIVQPEKMGNMEPVSALEDLAGCDVIIEAIKEDMTVKKSVFERLDQCCPETTIFASNTSALSISEMSKATRFPERFGGLHFHIPVMVIHAVEIISGEKTSPETIGVLTKVAETMGKHVIVAKDTPGFITNRLLIPYILDAIRFFEQGYADRDSIDISMRIPCRHPMGPLLLADYIGLDSVLSMSKTLLAGFGEDRFRAPTLLEELVSKGHVGVKRGRGFYNYDNPEDDGDHNASITVRLAELLQ